VQTEAYRNSVLFKNKLYKPKQRLEMLDLAKTIQQKKWLNAVIL